jgi:predicted ATPase
MGDSVAAERAIAVMSDWATRLDATLWRMIATCWKAVLLIERGEFAQGVELLSPALKACEQSGWQMGYVQFLRCLAEGLAGLGDFEQAVGKLERAIAWADHTGEAWCRAELLRMKGELTLRQSGIARAVEAEDCFQAATEIAREQGALLWELRTALSLARLRITQGRRDEARQLLAPVYDRFTEGLDTSALRASRALLDGASR